MDVITDWLQQHAGRIILLVIVMAIAMIATKVVVRVTNEVLGAGPAYRMRRSSPTSCA